MKKFFLIIFVVGIIMAGCTPIVPNGVAPGEQLPTPDNSNPTSHITYEGSQTIPDLAEGFGVNERATFDGIYPGWSGTVPLTITNGQDKDRLFRISVISADPPASGYEALPQQYFYWLTISQPIVTVPKGEACQVPITLTMPVDADYKGKKVEVWILVEDTTQTGLVQIAVVSRWFIITAD